MTFLIAAAGTGGHVFPGLAVGEALVTRGIDRGDVVYVGGQRLEAEVYPAAGFPFVGVELRGLQRSMTLKNLSLPMVVWRARGAIASAIEELDVGVALGMGGYVTIPTAMAARSRDIPLMVAEQNAGAGLANRIAARWAVKRFTSFPETEGLPAADWVGNPVRRELAAFDAEALRPQAHDRFGLDPSVPVLGVFGGSLGAGVINTAVSQLIRTWAGPPIQVLHLTGTAQFEAMETKEAAPQVVWRRIAFEDRMELFYAACDLVIARAGGAVAELAVTGSPSILVPGEFGSAGHQPANAAFFEESGAAHVMRESELADLPAMVEKVLFDSRILADMSRAATSIARPDAADVIAEAMIEVAK